ncbi:MAG: undecaprenyl/decaprenyl-phosphate alpha-N-acetylglucosaminyl 1-phosphate transferase [Phycisphaerales bacterium]|nr:undecaprenyl/decaprenyl-phosphate alpha-N-acetylglucosaminyl 1-phosphate transferase [Phycisphaerales bacterium]
MITMPLDILLAQTDAASDLAETLPSAADAVSPLGHSRTDILSGYVGVLVVAFLVTLAATPIMRRLAIANGVVDNPGEARKAHRIPVAYLGGVAVFLGLVAGVGLSYFGGPLPDAIYQAHSSLHEQRAVPPSIVLGMALIMLTGLIDDVVGLMPRVKVAGQLLAAAALAMEEVGTNLARGVMKPIGEFIGNPDLTWAIDLPFTMPMVGTSFEIDVIYWVGTGIIAVFVLGACNASNLVDGLDGLLSGVTAIAAAGLLIIALNLAVLDFGGPTVESIGSLDSARIIVALSLLGACLGFLPHNFNPATIFLGDCGSLLMGYVTIVLVLSLGDQGMTHLVIAGLIIYSIPIMDTALAIIRRKMAGLPMSAPDDQHLHHMLKRALGVKGAVLALYGLGIMFACLGVMLSMWKGRIVFTIALIITSFIGVYAVKVARRRVLEEAAMKLMSKSQATPAGQPETPGTGRPRPEPDPKAPSPV